MAFSLPKNFVSSKGRHSPGSFGKDLNLDKISKIDQNNENISSNDHSKIHDILKGTKDVLTDGGLKFGEKLAVAAIETGINSLLNHADEQSALSQLTTVDGLGLNTSTRTKINVHIGQPAIARINRQCNTPLVEPYKKELSSTDKDYQKHNKRKHLNITNGFNEKKFTFFMEDTFLRIQDVLDIFEREPRIEKNIKRNTHGITDVYGCFCYVKNTFKFKNTLNFYNLNCKLHLVKINDIHDDVRSLISEITNNNLSIPIINKAEGDEKPGEKNDKNLRQEVKDTIKNVAKSKAEEIADKIIDRSNILKEGKSYLKDILKTNGSHRGSEFGRIPEDEQYSDPRLDDRNNKFSVSFDTSLKTNLNDSVQFRDRAKIIKTWYKSLSPGSMWEFSLTQHFGKGIHLNYVYDIKNLNNEHPAQYIFILETFGDVKASLSRKEDNDLFTGYGPGKAMCEFKHILKYIAKQTDEYEEMNDPIPSVYRNKKRDDDFVEESKLAKAFHPDREASFHINFNDIELFEHVDKKSAAGKQYKLQYDVNVLPETTLMEGIVHNFTNHGYEGKNLTENDASYNVTTPPSDQREYEGTEGETPDIYDFDEENKK